VAETATGVPALGWRQLLGEGRGRLTAGILLVEFVAAVQSSVVASIMPAVAHDIGGIQFYGLVFSGYALASIAATPNAGEAADSAGTRAALHGDGRDLRIGHAAGRLRPVDAGSGRRSRDPGLGRRRPVHDRLRRDRQRDPAGRTQRLRHRRAIGGRCRSNAG